MPTEKLEFTGQGRARLAARLDLPEGPLLSTALFAHCFACGRDITPARRIAGRLVAQGIAVLRFDFTGMGHDGGEYEHTGTAACAEDLLAAARALEARGLPPALMIGHSLAGAAALRAAAGLPGLRALGTIGAPFDPARELVRRDEISGRSGVPVSLGGREVRLGRAFLREAGTGPLGPHLKNLRAALLVMHAPRDAVFGISNAGEIFAAAPHPKSFISLDDADHLLSSAGDAEYAAGVIAAWAGRYLDLPAPAPPPGVPEGVTRVCEADPAGFLQDVTSGPHHILADEPRAYGGTNRGMSPYALLAAGLGACTSMTLRMYARRKGWKLEHVAVDVLHQKVHAQDSADSNGGAWIDRFRREIRLEGDLDPAQRERLREIADRCPVHRTLEGRAEIETVLTHAGGVARRRQAETIPIDTADALRS